MVTTDIKSWFRSGAPGIWLTASAVSMCLILVFGVLAMTALRGLGYFWPAPVVDVTYQDPERGHITLIGEIQGEEQIPLSRLHDIGVSLPDSEPVVTRYLVKTGNRDALGFDFRWVIEPLLSPLDYPRDIAVIERQEWGNQYGYIRAIKENGQPVATDDLWREFQQRMARVQALHEQVRRLEKHDIGKINYQLEQLRLAERRLELAGTNDDQQFIEIAAQRRALHAEFGRLEERLRALKNELARDTYTLEIMDGRRLDYPFAKVVNAHRPNAMGLANKIVRYFAKLWEFVSTEPREANTEGGIFPAIFGTVLMVFLMSIFVTPLGIVAAVYLREYATQGPLTRLIRIAVNNLAGVPSIVYGLFGLGFFVYFLGGSIDRLFFPEALPAPTFGTGGILWASLTLAILTLPVVIVATEEGLSRIPKSIREGSLALGATKIETLWRTVLPMATPAMMTGLILAVARAAGEVAPLMLVGVVKLAPSLPLDGNFPFLHLDRKFMHLGFHIYDVGFQSPNVEAARPLVYATAFLLVLVIMTLNIAAIAMRNRLREKYRHLES